MAHGHRAWRVYVCAVAAAMPDLSDSWRHAVSPVFRIRPSAGPLSRNRLCVLVNTPLLRQQHVTARARVGANANIQFFFFFPSTSMRAGGSSNSKHRISKRMTMAGRPIRLNQCKQMGR